MIGFPQAMATALTWQRAFYAYGRMYVSAQEVMHHRLTQMALGQMDLQESARMVWEKPTAFAAAMQGAAMATAAGAPMPAVALAAVKPIGEKTQANAKRLRRRQS